jgi:beta-carotene hydroxylase
MKSLITAPRIAWPTLAVAALALVTWLAGLAIAGPAGIALATVGAYLAFTPLHEAAHRSLARARWVNEVIGRIVGIPLAGPFVAVRYLHLEHHKHTNDPDADPDHWSGRGPGWLLPLRWLTQDLHYYAVYLTARRRWRERAETVGTLAAYAVAAIVLIANGHSSIVIGWLVGARLAIGVLAFAFDYLPHRPHRIPARIDRFAATAAWPGRLKLVATLGQSLHRVHHFYPGVPFYRYAALWRAGSAQR